MRIITAIIIFFSLQYIHAQHSQFQQIIESTIIQQDESADYSDIIANLTDIYKDPISINSATKENLEQLIFLSDEQIEEILFSRYMSGDFTTPYQLQRVNGLDSLTITKLIPFIKFDESTQRQEYTIKSQTVGRCNYLFETPQGFIPQNDSIKPNYRGDKFHSLLRMNATDNRNNEIGLVMEKDAGEEYICSKTKSTDYLSGYYQTKKHGFLKNIILGDYNLSFGQGLVSGQGMMNGKSGDVTKIKSGYRGITKHASSAENGFFRGIAATTGTTHYTNTSFISYRTIDAKIITDSTSGLQQISTLYTTGLHRTTNEIETKNKAQEIIYGTAFKSTFTRAAFEVGAIGYSYNYPFMHQSELYQLYNQQKQHGANFFANANGYLSGFRLHGEIALSEMGATAFTGGCVIKANAKTLIALQARAIAKEYTAPRLKTFSESSQPAGETGIYLACSFQPLSKTKLSTYIDVFQYKWLRYMADAPSKGSDWMAQITHTIDQNCSLEYRIKMSTKEVNYSEIGSKTYTIKPEKNHSQRIVLKYNASENLEFASRIDNTNYRLIHTKKSKGVAISQDIRYNSTNNRLTIVARASIFNSDNYESRIYLYEPDLLYNYTSQQFMNKGIRLLCNLGIKFNQNLTISFRISKTKYENIETIGSGNDAINHNHKTEGKVQLIMKI